MVVALLVAGWTARDSAFTRIDLPDRERVLAAYANLPLTFVENRGQTHARCASMRRAFAAASPAAAARDAAGTDAGEPAQRREVLAGRDDYIRLERRLWRRELHDPHRRQQQLLGAAHREPVDHGVTVHEERTSDDTAMVARPRERFRRCAGRLVVGTTVRVEELGAPCFLLSAGGASGSSPRRVQCHGGANERLQRLFINPVALVEINRTPGVAVEAGVEEA